MSSLYFPEKPNIETSDVISALRQDITGLCKGEDIYIEVFRQPRRKWQPKVRQLPDNFDYFFTCIVAFHSKAIRDSALIAINAVKPLMPYAFAIKPGEARVTVTSFAKSVNEVISTLLLGSRYYDKDEGPGA